MHTAPPPAAPAERPGSPGAAAPLYVPQEMEQYPNWLRASGVVRDSCRISAGVVVLPAVPFFFSLILMLMLDLGLPALVLECYRRMLAGLPLDAEGHIIGAAAAAAAAGAAGAAAAAGPAAAEIPSALVCTTLSTGQPAALPRAAAPPGWARQPACPPGRAAQPPPRATGPPRPDHVIRRRVSPSLTSPPSSPHLMRRPAGRPRAPAPKHAHFITIAKQVG